MIIKFFIVFIIFIFIIFIYFSNKQNKKKIVIGGCAYNCGKYIDKVFENILKIISLYNDYLIIIAYDKSSDDTLEKLELWQHSLKKMIILKGEKTSNIRTENLSIARNKILNTIRREYYFDHFKHFIILDLDNVCSSPININLLSFYLKKDSEWDALSFNRPKYYDIWALSYDPFIISVFHWTENKVDYIRQDIESKLKNRTELFECYSAFNGFAIYKSKIFIKSYYEWRFSETFKFITPKMLTKHQQAFPTFIKLKTDNRMDCEHRFFHFLAHFNLNARIRISPQFLFI
jgi:hypothetical protein